MSRPWRLALFAILLAALAGVVFTRLSVTTDMSKMMPTGEGQRDAQLAKAILASQLSQTVLVSLRARSTEEAVMASQLLEQRIRARPRLRDGFRSIQTGPPQGLETSLWETYAPRRLAFVARSEAEAQELVADEGLSRVPRELKERLLSPLSSLVTRTAPADPFLALPRLFEALEKGAPRSLQVVDGRYVAQDRWGIVFLELEGSSFDADAQEGLLAELEEVFGEVRQRMPSVRVEWSALARFSVRAKQSIKRDVTRVSVVSSLLVVGMCLVLFRSFSMLLLTFTPILAGMLGGLFALSLWSGEVHGLTLAFGASLIGVCIDAVVHFYLHYLTDEGRHTPREVMRQVAPAMALGGLTTVVGFLVLSQSPLLGLSQAAVFGAVGILAAYLSTFWVLPDLVGTTVRTPRLLKRLEDALAWAYRALDRRIGVFVGLFLVAIAVSAWGLSQVRFNGDWSRLISFSPELKAEDERVRGRVAQFDTSRFVVALGDTDELALRNNERVREALEKAVAARELDGFQSVATLLPSARTQEAVARIVRGAELRERLAPVLEEAGFQVEAFAPFWEELSRPKIPPSLSYAEIERTPLEALVAPHRVEVDGQVGWLTYLRGPHRPDAISARFGDSNDIVFVDQTALMSRLDHRPGELALLFSMGMLGIFALLGFRYRNFWRALSALVPALVATVLTVGWVSCLGYSLNLVAVSALLMVLSMGADYGVFMAENVVDGERHLRATLGALFLACLTTVVSFSVLALSDQQVLRVIGLIAAIGVSLSFVLSIFSSVLVSRFVLRGQTGS